ncbi:hypothetical protein EJ05DRAFT_507580 [Pseudovirgaria hyperparasitica]|uniref:Zn(2)-C6 fungal-type domain-containing protein n=1 Tax=Pseudovirgaria hyperparasitica TaxID=470096 RepID=A0A6A6WGN8_9PEZI|nr:uncharacterized protein EJ05DRAFT_507580 [Pseudovirgaria hyperparasitica]KAF2761978.1 hypothetical protein EJ05DRAFT_507580 [Pseudovirgaria hyperparasitica]
MGINSPEEAYFNDLSQQPPPSEFNARNRELANNEENGIPKTKRIACILCRKRKLRCDGAKPACGTCKRLTHDCAYDEVRRKSGPKRGYVKALEARLQQVTEQVETLIRTQDGPEPTREQAPANVPFPMSSLPPNMTDSSIVQTGTTDQSMFGTNGASPGGFAGLSNGIEMNTDEQFPWEIISLGLEEPLPPQEDINELNRLYFEKVHPSIPMIHKPRFQAAMNLAPHMRPAVCLRYIMWAFAASLTDRYESLQEHFYQRARKYAQMDEMKGHGEAMLTLGHAQAWILICTYEFKSMYFPRAWMSAGRAVRLAQMMGLHRQDGAFLDVKQCLPPPKDWTEQEERRRTFWGTFCIDRYASIGTGWPMTIDEKDIMSNLPASGEAYERSKAVPSISLEQALTPSGAASVSAFGAVILMACLFGRNLHHLHRPTPDDREGDLNGGFWKRHRDMQNTIDNTSLNLPDMLRLPSAMGSANAIFTNMCLHTSAICLHQAAIYKAEKNRLPASVSNESKIRCVTAAAEIANIMRMISHMDLAAMNPFISFSVYVAARVFVQYLKTRPNDQQMISSLQFLMSAMQVLKRRNPLTESFMVQLDLDLEDAGIPGLRTSVESSENGKTPPSVDKARCSPIVVIGEQQSQSTTLERSDGGSTGDLATEPGLSMPTQSTTFTGNTPISSRPSLPPSAFYEDIESKGALRGIIVPVMDSNTPEGEMDTSPDTSGDQPTPSTSNSRHGSSSHTSFTPPRQDDTTSHTHHYHSAHNPLTSNNQSSAGSSNSQSIHSADFFPASSGGYAGMNSYYPVQPSMPSLGLSGDWDIANANLSDSAWSQMLEGMGMNWDGVGPSEMPHSQQVDPLTGRRVV